MVLHPNTQGIVIVVHNSHDSHYCTGAHDYRLITCKLRLLPAALPKPVLIAIGTTGNDFIPHPVKTYSEHALYIVSVPRTADIIPHVKKDFYNIL